MSEKSDLIHYFSLQRNSARAERNVNVQVPLVKNDLDKSEESLAALSKTLPTVQEQVTNIRNVYDSGRRKVIQANHSISFE